MDFSNLSACATTDTLAIDASPHAAATALRRSPKGDRDERILALIERLMAEAEHLAASLRLQEGATDDLRSALAAERTRSAGLQIDLAEARRDLARTEAARDRTDETRARGAAKDHLSSGRPDPGALSLFFARS